MKFDTILSKAGYFPDTSNQVWARPDYPGIAYSDGDEIENRIGAIIDNAADLSVFSIELAAGVTDWASLYHLSGSRANILRPFMETFADRTVLEIGAGCGAITRFLGESGAQVLALEGTARRAAIARSRTRDLSNVTVLADRFEDLSLPLRFDVVTLIGVLEYAPLFTKGEDPLVHMLLKARDLLKPGGKLIVAIENQLGLKYLAGFPEDHVWVPMYGIEGRYRQKEVTTFGRKTLRAILKRAGFTHQSFMAPFPDYKFPLSIVTEQGFACESFDAGALAWQSANRDPQKPRHLVFAPELAWPVVAANGLSLDLANSFLILAQTVQQPTSGPPVLAYHYSTANRLAAYCKQTVFQASSDGGIEIRYALLCRETLRKSGKKVQFDLANRADYVVGTSLAFEFITSVSRSGWTMDEVGQCLRRYLRIVESVSAAEGVPLSIDSPASISSRRTSSSMQRGTGMSSIKNGG
jgi:SAM-dependent methyltransferase